MFIRPIKFSLVVVSPLLNRNGTASKEGGARTGGGMAVCAGNAGREKFAPPDCLPLGGVDILDKAMTIANSCHNSNPRVQKIGLFYNGKNRGLRLCFYCPRYSFQILKKLRHEKKGGLKKHNRTLSTIIPDG